MINVKTWVKVHQKLLLNVMWCNFLNIGSALGLLPSVYTYVGGRDKMHYIGDWTFSSQEA